MKKEEPDRAQRLAEALRANLRRRKGQTGNQAIGAPAQNPADESAADVSS